MPLIFLLVVVRVVDALHEGLAVGDLVRQGGREGLTFFAKILLYYVRFLGLRNA